ncbi:MAG TPA: SPOR domain-containing protein [Candidatus Angelobacter sp.]|nr:SPOR domain-containing protein [Candidatus Angelobacter sp.]
MAEPDARDTEITLGTGKLLGIFFVITAVCAVFFTMGYLMGRSSTPGSGSTTIVSAVPTSGNPANKPSASAAIKAPETQAANTPDANASTAAAAKDPAAVQQPVTLIVPKSTDATPDANSNPAAQTKTAATGTYMVQVAAVTRQEDADLLVNALRKKEYPVFVANVPGDSLFHVQVGPFSDPKEAEAMRARLAGDGYNAIVKK